MGQMAHSLSLSSNPAGWKHVAAKYSRLMSERAEVARITCAASTGRTPVALHRAQELEANDVVLNAFLKYFQRSGQYTELMQLWSMVTPTHKHDNPHSFLVMLNYCSQARRADFAERLMAEFASLGLRWIANVFSAWIGCYQESGDVIAAERIWQRMLSSKVRPTGSTYTRLLLVYITARRPGAIDRVLAEMRKAGVGGAPIAFDAKNYVKLIKHSAGSGQYELKARWRQMATAAGVTLPTPPPRR